MTMSQSISSPAPEIVSMSLDKQATVQQVVPSETDTNFDSTNINAVYPYPISMLTTVKHDKFYFAKRKIGWANADMDFPTCIGWPSPTKLEFISNQSNFKITKL